MSDSGGTIRTLWVFDAASGVQATQQARAGLLGVQKASDTLTPAQARAALTAGKLATEQGKGAVQAQRLATEEQKTAAQASNASAAQDRAALSALRLANAQNKAAGGNSFAAQTAEAFKSQLLGIVGPAAVATAALGALKGAAELAQLGAQADLIRIRFDSLAQSAGIAGDELLAALRKGSGREISDLNLQLAANKAQLLGVAHSAEEFGVLMSIARDRAQQMGITTTQAFDDLVTGLGRGSRLILDNLGILVNADQANQVYARSIGKTVAQLTDQERKQALINQVLKDGQATIAATGGAVESAAAGQARLSASWDNVKASAGSAISQGVAPLVNSLSDLINMSDGSEEGVRSLVNGLIDFNRQVSGLPPLTAAQTKAQQDWTRSVQEWIIARGVQLGLMEAPAPASSGGGGAFEFADVALARESTAAQLGYADALAMTGVQQRAAAQAAEQKSTADKVAAVDAQTHGIAEGQLATQAQNAARALLVTGPAGARTAALLASSSGQVDVLTAAYFRLFAAQQAAASVDPLKGVSEGRSDRDTAGDRAAGLAAGRDAQAQAAQARLQQLIQTGTAAQKAAALQKEYNNAVKQFGVNSKEAINAQTNLIQAQQAADKAGKGRVSAAQTTGLQLQNVEENTQAALLKAQREGQERLRDAAQDYQLSRSRKQEDENQKIEGLLARGQKAEAARERARFAIEQRRDAEDEAIKTRRTLRNNAESVGDTTAAADRRSGQIEQRAALRGVGGGGTASSAGGAAGASQATAGGAQRVISITFPSAIFAPDGQKLGDIVYPFVSQRLDDDWSIEIRSATPPGGGQTAVSGVRP